MKKEFTAPFISPAEIRKKVEFFRKQHQSCQKIPIDIEYLIEIDLKFDVVPIDGLKQNFDIDALILSDRKTIVIDKELHMHDNTNRLRYSLAHELGHYVLHEEVWSIFNFDSPHRWIEFQRKVDSSQYGYLEGHANEFAGRLLVPYEKLLEEVNALLKKLPSNFCMNPEEIVPYFAPTLCRSFEVSDQVIEIRIEREKIIDVLDKTINNNDVK